MNKLAIGLVSLFFLSPALYAADDIQTEEKKSGIFIGLDYFDGATEITREITSVATLKRDLDHSGVRLKFGVQDQNNIRFQAYIKIEDLEVNVPVLSSDGKIFGLGADALFTFPTSSNFRPYALLGMSSDFAELDDSGVEYSEDTLRAFSLKAGLGGLFKLNNHIELQAGYDVQYRSWQEIEVIDLSGVTSVEQHDVAKTFHVGLNFFF
jgi:opacity protein-like surface antigen